MRQLSIDPIKQVLLRISKGLTDEEKEDLKFLCSDKIGAGILEKLKSPIEFFTVLQQTLGDTEENFKIFIVDLLHEIGRDDLCNEWNKNPREFSVIVSSFLKKYLY